MKTENNNRIDILDTLVTRKLNIESSVLLQPQDDLHVVVNNYVKERVVTVRPSAPRYTVEVTAEKRKLRLHQCNVVINLIKSLKSEYYSSIIKENSNFSNLKALSKIIEKSVALQLTNYLMNNNLLENFQSAYKVHHSTETVMVKV